MLRRQMVFGWPDTVLPRDAGFGSGVCRGSQKLVRTWFFPEMQCYHLSFCRHCRIRNTNVVVGILPMPCNTKATLTPLPSKRWGQIEVPEVPRTMNSCCLQFCIYGPPLRGVEIEPPPAYHANRP
jgi:hypothetical protein